MSLRGWPPALCSLLVVATLTSFTAAQRPATAPPSLERILGGPYTSDLTAARVLDRVGWLMNQRGVRSVWIVDGPDFSNARPVVTYPGDDGQLLSGLSLSADGRTAVYVRGERANAGGLAPNPANLPQPPHQEIWAVDLPAQLANGHAAPRLIANMDCQRHDPCLPPRISPSGQWVSWASHGQIWLAALRPLAPGEAYTTHAIVTVQGNNFDPQWSPDSRSLAFTSSRGDHSFIGLVPVPPQPVGAAPPIITWLAPSVDQDGLPRWSLDGSSVDFVRVPGTAHEQPILHQPAPPWQILQCDVREDGAGFSVSAPRQLYQSVQFPLDSDPLPDDNTDILLTPLAGARLAFLSWRDGHLHLYATDGSRRVASPRLLTPGAFDIADVSVSSDGRHIFYTANAGDSEQWHLWRIDVAGDGFSQPRPAMSARHSAGAKPGSADATLAVEAASGIEFHPVFTAHGELVALGSGPRLPVMPFLITRGGRKLLAGATLAGFPFARLVQPQAVSLQAPDGVPLRGQLFLPPNAAPGQRWPAVVFLHGGPMRQMLPDFNPMEYYQDAYAENQELALRGIVVLALNYRGGTMYGRDFRYAPGRAWQGASEYQDVVSAATWLRQRADVRANAIGVWGGSWGGYLTGLALARNSDVFAAGVDLHGVEDWRTEHTVAADAPDLKQEQALAFASSPDAAVAQWRSPVLLIQGDDDRNVAFSQMVDLVQRLRRQGTPCSQLVLPGEVHEFLRWQSWLTVYQATTDFLLQHLNGATPTH